MDSGSGAVTFFSFLSLVTGAAGCMERVAVFFFFSRGRAGRATDPEPGLFISPFPCPTTGLEFAELLVKRAAMVLPSPSPPFSPTWRTEAPFCAAALSLVMGVGIM